MSSKLLLHHTLRFLMSKIEVTSRDSTLVKGEVPIVIGGFTKFTAPPQPDIEHEHEDEGHSKDPSSPRRGSPGSDEKDMDNVGKLIFVFNEKVAN